MKYFTPELYVAMQACETPEAARAANARWERAFSRYHAQLNELTRSAPVESPEGERTIKAVERLISLGSLHDAEVREIGTTEGARLVMVLKGVNRAGTVLLTYSLVEPPQITSDVIAPEYQSRPRTWLYDELELDARNPHNVRHAGRESAFPVFRHSVLLSDGTELALRFYRLEIMEISRIPDTQGRAPAVGGPVRTTA